MRIRNSQRKQKGQTIMLVAGALVALIALVALAVDGGNAYNQRRIAQNSVDGATNAAIVKLYQMFDAHRNPTTGLVSPITPPENAQMLQLIKQTLAASGYGNAATDPNHYGIDTVQASAGGTLEAYYLKSDGTRYGSSQIGIGTANFQDHDNPNGLTGIWIKTTATAPTYFARLIGQDKVQSDAHAGGKLMTAVSLDHAVQGAKIWPLALNVTHIPPQGQQITIYQNGSGNRTGPGNWYEIDFNGGGNSNFKQWIEEGFDPQFGLHQDYELHPFSNNRAEAGPNNDKNYLTKNTFPLGNDGSGTSGTHGVWLDSKQGVSINASCAKVEQAATEHWNVLIPIYDVTNNGNGAAMSYHVIGLAKFRIESVPNCAGQNIQITGTFGGWASTAGNGDPNLTNSITLGNVILQIGQ
jgi:hypothetical protein